jgi:hypothetical protein
MTLNEVAPPGYGHTKGDKKKGVEKGGTAAAFDRARKEGRFKGSKSDMFAIMWSQKNKGDKPHYKPGTDKKYKKYQEEQPQFNAAKELVQHSDYMKPALQQKKKKKVTEASAVLDANTKISKDEKKKKKEAELRRLLQHAIAVKKGQAESFEIDTSAHKKAQKKSKMRNLARGNENPNEKAAAEKKAGGPKLMGEGKKWDSYKKAVSIVLGKKKEKKAEKATDAGARARRKLQRADHAKYVSGSEDNVPDEMRD